MAARLNKERQLLEQEYNISNLETILSKLKVILYGKSTLEDLNKHLSKEVNLLSNLS